MFEIQNNSSNRKNPIALQLKVKAVIRNKTSDKSEKVQQAIKNILQELKIYFQT